MRRKHPELAMIPTQELESVRLYFVGGYKQMNATLRGDTPEFLSRITPLVKMAASACNRLPSLVGTTYRGAILSPAQTAAYEVGRVVTEKGFLSTTQDGHSWHLAPEHSNTLFVINASKNGHDICALSRFFEKEVLFVPGTRFKVLSKDIDASGKTVVYMNEVTETPP